MILANADLVDARMKIDYYKQALVIARETGYRRGEGIQPANLGVVYKGLNGLDRNRYYWQQALRTF